MKKTTLYNLMSYQPFVEAHQIGTVRNCFLMPTASSEIVEKGTASLAMLSNLGLQDIQVRLLPAETMYAIPEGVTTIGNSAFINNIALVTPVFPSTLATIEANAFRNTKISSAIIHEGVTSIDSQAFYYCKNLKSVKLPASLSTLGSNTFGASNNITEVTILSSELSIDNAGITASAVICAPEGSAAEAYASENSQNFEIYVDRSCGDSAEWNYDADTHTLTISFN